MVCNSSPKRCSALSGWMCRVFILALMVCVFAACRLTVSLTGGDIDPRAKTVYVQTFPNNATLVNPTLSQDFTTALKDMIQRQTPLTIVNSQPADYLFEGRITGYHIAPVAIQGDETAAMNRLTITVSVKFTNTFDEDKCFEQSFSRYVDYSSSQNFTAVESGLVSEINEALTDDIFNKSFVNW